ncbi:hypothetical protein AAEX28_07200 [Lentisphaerota bacterium WC36G]|nr:hypothetical protein LJT99_10065 [Lentisphaerae bacterium WC36]UDQ99304.1 hypothetical protein LJT99_07140 [Lentisphaerae bacterium WC36]
MSLEKIKEKIQKLINLRMSKGIQLEQLVGAIFDKEYIQIITKKKENEIVCEILFKETINEKNNLITITYYYDLNKNLIRISEFINGKTTVIFNKTQTEKKLLNEVIELLKQRSKKELDYFFNSLPADLISHLKQEVEK